MKTQDALNLLGLKPSATFEEIKTAYKEALKKYHPDINPAGLEMTKALNEAYESLKGYEPVKEYDESEIDLNYGDAFNAALNALLNLDISVELCGAWIWVSGDTYSVKDDLKAAAFKFARKKKMWYFRPEKYRSKNRRSWDIEKIRSTHGSKAIRKGEKKSDRRKSGQFLAYAG